MGVYQAAQGLAEQTCELFITFPPSSIQLKNVFEAQILTSIKSAKSVKLLSYKMVRVGVE